MRRQIYWKTIAAQRVKQIAGVDDIDLAIEKIVKDLLSGLVCPPTDLDSLAQRMDITDIRRDNMMLVPGELRKLHDGLVVFLFPNLTKTRRRFTLAHEFGHAFFEKAGRRPHPSQELERLCDKFATEFLMPRQTFISYAGRYPDLGRVRKLCQIFETGLQATLGRVSDIYYYRTFELKNSRVIWSRRLNMSILCQINEQIQESSNQVQTKVIDLYERNRYSTWHLEWEFLGVENHRIGLLRPM